MKQFLLLITLLAAFASCKKDEDTSTVTPTPTDYAGTYTGDIKVSYPAPDPWDTTISNFGFNVTKSGDNYTITSALDASDNATFTVDNGTINRVSGNKAFSKSLTGTISTTDLKIQFSGIDDDNEAFTGSYSGTKSSTGGSGNNNDEQYGYIVYNGTKYEGVHPNLATTGQKGCMIHSTPWKGTANPDDEMINIILPAGSGAYSSDGCGDPRSSGLTNDWISLDLPDDLSNDITKLMAAYHYKSGSVTKTVQGEYELIEFNVVVVHQYDANKTTTITGKMRAKDD